MSNVFGGFDYGIIQAMLLAGQTRVMLVDILGNVVSDVKLSDIASKIQPLRDKIDQGFGFSASDRGEDVPSGSTFQIMLENPANSGKTIHIVTVECTSTGQARVDIYHGGSITGGTSITPRNLDLSITTNQSVAQVTSGGTVDVTGLTPSKKTVVPGGKSIRVVGGAAEIGEAVKMPPGTKLLVIMTNTSGVNADMAIEYLWWEE